MEWKLVLRRGQAAEALLLRSASLCFALLCSASLCFALLLGVAQLVSLSRFERPRSRCLRCHERRGERQSQGK